MQQGGLIFKKSQVEVSDSVILKYEDPKRLLHFAAEVSAIPFKEIAFQMDMDEKQFIRCLSNNPHETRHFPFERIEKLMDVICNEIPLRWLALRRGYGLVRLKSEVERENEFLKSEIARLERDRDVVVQFFREAKP